MNHNVILTSKMAFFSILFLIPLSINAQIIEGDNKTIIIQTNNNSVNYPQTNIDLVVQLIATLIGVLIGAQISIAIRQKSKRDEQYDKKILNLSAIIAEITYNVNELTRDAIFWNNTTKSLDGSSVIISSYSFESIKNSGDLSVLPPSLQIALNDVYLITNEFNEVMDTLINLPYTIAATFGSFNQDLQRLLDEKNLVKTNFIISCRNVINEIKIHLN